MEERKEAPPPEGSPTTTTTPPQEAEEYFTAEGSPVEVPVAKEISYLLVLPALFLEFLAIAFTKSLLPGKLNVFFGERVYWVMGVAETVKGALAFGACPLFGRVSDVLGRCNCLLVTVIGTTLPCWILAFTDDLWVYAAALGLSGLFAATFTLVFAYIADVVPPKDRAPAYGLALATLGLSFTIGPPLGAFAADQVGETRVFLVSLVLTILDVAFIALVLPETVNTVPHHVVLGDIEDETASEQRRMPETYSKMPIGNEEPTLPRRDFRRLTRAFDATDTLHLFRGDPLLSRVAIVTLLYYSGVWALVTTIVIYVVRVFGMTTVQVGWLLGTYGLSTMIAEGFLVRVIVPAIGELGTMRLGLVAFAGQCALVAVAQGPNVIFASISLSLLSNLVYPSISSLVSRMVPEDQIGEALGAINGVKALTEGAGPLTFAALMSTFEQTNLPGFPYLACSVVAVAACYVTYHIPDEAAYAVSRPREKNAELVALLDDHDEPDADEDLDDDDSDIPDDDSLDLGPADVDPMASETPQSQQYYTPNSTARKHRSSSSRSFATVAAYTPGLTTNPATFRSPDLPEGRPVNLQQRRGLR